MNSRTSGQTYADLRGQLIDKVRVVQLISLGGVDPSRKPTFSPLKVSYIVLVKTEQYNRRLQFQVSKVSAQFEANYIRHCIIRAP